MTEEETEADHQPKRLKSKSSMVCSFLRFVNKTSYNVDIVWINYEGHRARYRTLRPNEFVDVNTYVGHPWIFIDSDTGNRMVVQMKEVFEPTEGWKPEDNVQPQRKVYNITIPLYPLKERCLQYLSQIVKQENIEELDLPRNILTDLEDKFETFSRRNRIS
ncbi:VHL [Mytilus coruscus]|uniref:VHL n=1 Tax=Mytilus coruscus TaxID=42192 RepID=A0A6J8AFJ8_MYTCO|nr:VHL [Mytilus coruscus]